MALKALLYQQQELFGSHNNGANRNNVEPRNLLDSWSWNWSFPIPKENPEQSDNYINGSTSSSYSFFENSLYENNNSSNDKDDDNGEWDFSTTPLTMLHSFDDNDWVCTPPSSSTDNDYTPNNGSLEEFEVVDVDPLAVHWEPTTTSAPVSATSTSASTCTRPKRRRARTKKNKEDIENQRMTHIAVERNRRKQMNEYLAVLKSLMPDSYVQRGDQASIVGGAINFVKELEQNLQTLSAHKKKPTTMSQQNHFQSTSLPFGEFFSFPQYSTTSPIVGSSRSSNAENDDLVAAEDEIKGTGDRSQISNLGDVEVTMVDTHVNLKIRSRQRPKQLLKIVNGLQNSRLTILHLNVSTVDHIAFYSLSVKVEDDCNLSSVDEIATAVHQLLGRIDEELSSIEEDMKIDQLIN